MEVESRNSSIACSQGQFPRMTYALMLFIIYLFGE